MLSGRNHKNLAHDKYVYLLKSETRQHQSATPKRYNHTEESLALGVYSYYNKKNAEHTRGCTIAIQLLLWLVPSLAGVKQLT